jgi:hypothetical protein
VNRDECPYPEKVLLGVDNVGEDELAVTVHLLEAVLAINGQDVLVLNGQVTALGSVALLGGGVVGAAVRVRAALEQEQPQDG